MDWTTALDLRHDLEQAWHSADSDPAFRRATPAMPDDVWLDHYCASLALPTSELEAIDTRARALQAAHSPNAQTEALIGHVARDRRNWPDAARAYEAACALDPANTTWPGIAAECRRYARLANHTPADAGTPDHEVFVINLDRNIDRLADIERRFAGFPVPPQRLPAIDGTRLAQAAVAKLATPDAPRGTLGCFLSHAAAWERLLAGTAACALVLEDDAQPLLVLPTRFDALDLPPNWDLIWVNQRMQPQSDPDAATGFSIHPVLPAVRSFPACHDAPGGDGYLVSRQGARKLLDWSAADGLDGDVDLRMLAYSLSAQDVATLPPTNPTSRSVATHAARIQRQDRLQSHVLHPHLIRELSLRSTRIDADRMTAP